MKNYKLFIALLITATLLSAFFVFSKENKNELIFRKGIHHVIEDFIVPEEKTLILEPGAHLIMSKDVRISIKGKIIAKGTEKNPIVFEGNGDYWRGIEIIGNSSTPDIEEYKKYFHENTIENSQFMPSIQTGNIFSHCTFKNLATNGVRDIANRKKATIEASSTSLFITNSKFEDIVHIGAMQINDSLFLASNNTVTSRMVMKVFHIHDSVYILHHNDIIPKRFEFQTWPDGLFAARGLAIVAYNNWEGLSDDAIDFDATLGFVMGNNVNGTFDDGISFDNQSEGFAINNSISNVLEHGLMASNGAKVTFLNNSISNSQTGLLLRNGAQAWTKDIAITDNKDGILLYNGVPFALTKKQYDKIEKELSKINMEDAHNIALYEGKSTEEIVDFFKDSYYDVHGYKILKDSIAESEDNDFTLFAYLKKALKFIDIKSFENASREALPYLNEDTRKKITERKNFLYLRNGELSNNKNNFALKEFFDFKKFNLKVDEKETTPSKNSISEDTIADEKFLEAQKKAAYIDSLLKNINDIEKNIILQN